MRYFWFIRLIMLATSCAVNSMKIKTSVKEKPFMKDAYIRTTKIEVDQDLEENISQPLVEIISPKNNEIINGEDIIVRLNISNFRLVTPDRYPKKGQGHVQVWIDGMEFRSSDTDFIFENESNGSHVIKAELMLSNNTVLPYSKTIVVFVNNT